MMLSKVTLDASVTYLLLRKTKNNKDKGPDSKLEFCVQHDAKSDCNLEDGPPVDRQIGDCLLWHSEVLLRKEHGNCIGGDV